MLRERTTATEPAKAVKEVGIALLHKTANSKASATAKQTAQRSYNNSK